jgi:hypothetical protein
VIAIDGKVLRGSRLPDGRQVHLLSAYDTGTGVVLAQVQIAAKSNEIPAFTPLLDRVQVQPGSLTGVLIVADALHAQTGHAREVATRGAHLMVTVKANQPTLYNLLKALPWTEVPVGDQRRDKGHGRQETRTVKARRRRGPAKHRHRIPPRQRRNQHRQSHQTRQPPTRRPHRCRDQE